jgi:hypothetical protein
VSEQLVAVFHTLALPHHLTYLYMYPSSPLSLPLNTLTYNTRNHPHIHPHKRTPTHRCAFCPQPCSLIYCVCAPGLLAEQAVGSSINDGWLPSLTAGVGVRSGAVSIEPWDTAERVTVLHSIDRGWVEGVVRLILVALLVCCMVVLTKSTESTK